MKARVLTSFFRVEMSQTKTPLSNHKNDKRRAYMAHSEEIDGIFYRKIVHAKKISK